MPKPPFFKRIGLLGYIVIAIIAGLGLGFILPGWTVRIFVTINTLFSEFLGFVIPFLILSLVAPAIIEIGRGAGKMLVFTVVLAYVATILSGLLAYGTGSLLFPSVIQPGTVISEAAASDALQPFFTLEIEPVMTVTTSLVLAFVLGLCVSRLSSTALRDVLFDCRDVIIMVIRGVIVPFLPFYIFGIFLNMTYSGEAGSVLGTFIKVIGIIFVLHVVLLVAQYLIGGWIDGKNPLHCLKLILPAYFTALGTASSAATIPVTLKQTKLMGVDPAVADFTVPLCATIHLSGSTLKIVSCALALMILKGMPYDFPLFMNFIMMLAITMVAAPGVPGGAVMAALGVLSSILGFTDADNALIIALYITMDSFGTACNVSGDGALTLIVDRFFGNRKSVAVN